MCNIYLEENRGEYEDIDDVNGNTNGDMMITIFRGDGVGGRATAKHIRKSESYNCR